MSSTFIEAMINLFAEMENSKKALSHINNSNLKNKIKLEEKLKKISIIIGIVIVDENSINLVKNTWIRKVESLQSSGYQIEVIWIKTEPVSTNTGKLYFDLLTNTLYLSPTKYNYHLNTETRDKFLNYCRFYLNKDSKWEYVIFTSSTCYLNLEKLLFSSNFHYYHRYGEFIWHRTLVEYYFNLCSEINRFNKLTYRDIVGEELDEVISNTFNSNTYDIFNSGKLEIELNEIAQTQFKLKNTQIGVIHNPYNFYIIDNQSEKISYFNLQKLFDYIFYDYGIPLSILIPSTCFNLHYYCETLINKQEYHYYNLNLSDQTKIIHKIDSVPHLYWGCLAVFLNLFEDNHTLYEGKIFTKDHNQLRIIPFDDDDKIMYTPIYSGDQIMFPNLSDDTESQNSIYYIYKLDEETLKISENMDNEKILIKKNSKVILVNMEKSSYLKYKNNQYKSQLFIENIDEHCSEKGVWIINSIT